MRTRLTWQNVAAPDFSDALQGTRLAGSLFSDAFSNAVGIADDIRTGQKERASNAAITQALGITDPAEFARAVSTGAFGDSRNFTTEAMEFFQGQRGSLLDDQSTIARTQGQNLLNEAQSFRNQRAPIEAAQDDWRFNFDKEGDIYTRDRNRAEDQREDATRDMLLRATKTAGEIADNSLNLEEAKNQVIQMGLAPAEEQAVLENLDKVDPAQWAVSESLRNDVAATPVFNQIGESLDSRRVNVNMAFSSDENLRTYTTSLERFEGSQNPIQDVMRGVFGDAEESPEVAGTRSSMVNTFNDLVKKYDLPPEVVAGVMEESIRGTWFGLGSKVQLDRNAAEAKLKAMSDPAERNRLESRRQAYNREDEKLSSYETKAEKLLDRAAKAIRDGKPEKAREYEAKAQELWEEFVAYRKANPADGAMADRARRQEAVAAADRAAASNPVPAVPMVPNAAGTEEEMLNNTTPRVESRENWLRRTLPQWF